uniref:Uncharacterized protein n=1 Tax=Fagus sylvatica TaxID=28930 RepID=A0A2N9FFR7_FAGSY
MGRESKYGFALSWADEVEKEEEAQTQEHQKQKTNPFGSARPREVVLQERGIDWRKLDQDLQPPSNIRNKARNEKPSKENIPAPAAHVFNFNMIQSDPPSWGLEQKREETRLSSKRREVPWVPLAPQNQIPVIFSPPLRYPPKNHIPNWQQHFQSTNRLETDQNSELKNNRTESQELVLPIEAQRNGKKLRKSVACKNQQDAGPENEMKRFNAQNLDLRMKGKEVARKVTGSSMAAVGNGRRAGAGQTRKVKRAD